MLDLIHGILHLDTTLIIWSQTYGSYLYIILFLIIFCETGLVVTPFLPGDSLLFAAGALAATPASLQIKVLIPLLIVAAFAGDSLNYFIGKYFGRKLFEKESLFLKKAYLIRTESFYQKHGIKAVVLARFFPILRTFAPFVAGIGKMKYRVFFLMSLGGSLLWISTFSLVGYFFGQIEFIQKNFTTVVMALLILPGVPIVIAFLKSYRFKSSKN